MGTIVKIVVVSSDSENCRAFESILGRLCCNTKFPSTVTECQRFLSHHSVDPEKKKKLLAAWNDGDGVLPHYPKRSDYSTEHQANGFAMAMGGGLDVVITRALAWRVANFEYTHSWLADVDQIRASEGVRFTSGLTLRIGTW